MPAISRSEERFSRNAETDLVCRLLLEKKKNLYYVSLFFFNPTSTTEIYTLSLHDALPIYNLGNLLLLGKIGVFHNRRNASSRLLLLISKHLILCIYLVFRILA